MGQNQYCRWYLVYSIFPFLSEVKRGQIRSNLGVYSLYLNPSLGLKSDAVICLSKHISCSSIFTISTFIGGTVFPLGPPLVASPQWRGVPLLDFHAHDWSIFLSHSPCHWFRGESRSSLAEGNRGQLCFPRSFHSGFVIRRERTYVDVWVPTKVWCHIEYIYCVIY